jgi:hypothetical protein
VVAVHAVVIAGVKVQVKSLEFPDASAEPSPRKRLHPVPVIETEDNVSLPVLLSVTVIVTVVPAVTVEAGETLFVVSVIDCART